MDRIRISMMVVVFALASVSACADETGVLIRVTAAEDFDASPTSLRFYVGESIRNSDEYFTDRQLLPDEDVAGRDLRSKPFKLLVHQREGANARAMIAVGVLAFDEEGDRVGFGYVPVPIGFVPGSITQWEVELHDIDGPDYAEGDHGCFQWNGDAGTVHIGTRDDKDCDTYTKDEGDCNDNNPAVYPDAYEICGNDIDDDCDPTTDGEAPMDRQEVCNGLDDNCDGNCDEGLDEDGDTYTVCGSVVGGPEGQCVDYDPLLVDCDPGNGENYPGAAEVADGVDNSCSGACDDDPALDPDSDGFTTFGRFGVCSEVDDPNLRDCKPDLPYVYPGAPEYCDGYDTDCDGVEILETSCFNNVGGAGQQCLQGIRTCSFIQDGLAELGVDCTTPDAASVTVPLIPEVCGYYEGCEDNDADPFKDPFECSLVGADLVATVFETCTMVSTTTSHCPAANPGGIASIDLLVAGGGPAVAPCTFQLIGPKSQQGYYFTVGGGNNTLVNSCDAALTVVPTATASDAQVTLTRRDSGGNFQVIEVTISNTIVEDCGATPGLTCATWPTTNLGL